MASNADIAEKGHLWMGTSYIPDSTWTDLDQEPIFQKFMKEYLDLLRKSLTKIKIKGDFNNTIHYTCGQAHDLQNPSWKPFRLLTEICKKYNNRAIALIIFTCCEWSHQ